MRKIFLLVLITVFLSGIEAEKNLVCARGEPEKTIKDPKASNKVKTEILIIFMVQVFIKMTIIKTL